jgi:hypothetical protein
MQILFTSKDHTYEQYEFLIYEIKNTMLCIITQRNGKSNKACAWFICLNYKAPMEETED